MGGKRRHMRTASARVIQRIRDEMTADLTRKAASIAEQIGVEADKALLQVLKGRGLVPMPGVQADGPGMPVVPPLIGAIRLGLMRSGRLVERVETTDVRRPLREASEAELIAELDERDDDTHNAQHGG